MKRFQYETGRIYDSLQVLDCEVVHEDPYLCDIFDLDYTVYTIRFIDESRGIKGIVKTMDCSGEGVLAAYDQGEYDLC